MFPEQTKYWSLGVVVTNQTKKVIVQKEIDLNNFLVEKAAHISQPETPNNIYTLKTNYLIEPEAINVETFNDKNANIHKEIFIKDLILNEEYFEAAKQILYIEQKNTALEEFDNWDDFYYWASFVYYNLGNHNLAYKNINLVSNKENNPEILFLESLIIRDYGDKDQSNLILKRIINEFPHNDYSNYAKDILLDE